MLLLSLVVIINYKKFIVRPTSWSIALFLCSKKSTIATATLYRVILVFKVQHSFRESFSGSYNVRCYKTICTSSTLTSYKHYQSLFMYGIQRLFLSRSVHHIHPPYIYLISCLFENHTRCNQPITIPHIMQTNK